MKKLFLIPALTLGLAACQTTAPAPMPQLGAVHAPAVQPVQTREVKWKVYTAKELRTLLDDAKAKGEEKTLVLMALTPQGYQNHTFNLSELERYIREQKQVTIFLQDTINERAALGQATK